MEVELTGRSISARFRRLRSLPSYRPQLPERVGGRYTPPRTASFIPIEIWHALRHGTAGSIAAIALNLAIVAYLVARIIRRRHRAVLGGLPREMRT